MNKKSIAFWLIYSALLVFLYILSATDLIIKENETKVYSVSVLLNGISGENFENMKKGMDEAAYEYNVDMSFPVTAEDISLEEKTEVVSDAIESGAKALIIGNKWKKEVADEIRKRHPELPILVLGAAEDEDSVSLMYPDIADKLLENIKTAESVENEVCIIAENFADEEIEKIGESLKLKLETSGYNIKLAEGSGPKLDRQLRQFNKKKTVFISLDKESSIRLIKYAEDYNLTKNNSKIYVVGATDYLLGKLEDGEIEGMIGWNEYDMGYFIIEKLMKKLNGKNEMNKDEIEVFYITGEDLKNENYIKILYPINA